jgi:hypothetical protein
MASAARRMAAATSGVLPPVSGLIRPSRAPCAMPVMPLPSSAAISSPMTAVP